MTLLGAHLQPRDRPIWSGGLVTLLGEFGYSPGAARVALTRLVARDTFTRTKSGRHASYTLTPRTVSILAEGDQRIFALGRAHDDADGWTVLWHTVPESRRLERSRLTRRLRFLGFGSVQDGTWIAPRNHEAEVIALVDELGLRDHAAVMVGRPSSTLDVRRFVDRIWDLDNLAKLYREFVEQFGRYADVTARSGLDDRSGLVVRTQLVHAFRQFPFLDPELPSDVASPPEHRASAVKLFHDLYEALAGPAQRHFDDVTRVWFAGHVHTSP